MGMFAKTANLIYHLSFANQEKQTSIFPFRLQQTKGSLLFAFFCLQQTNESCRM
jgi:hypothetical protein